LLVDAGAKMVGADGWYADSGAFVGVLGGECEAFFDVVDCVEAFDFFDDGVGVGESSLLCFDDDLAGLGFDDVVGE